MTLRAQLTRRRSRFVLLFIALLAATLVAGRHALYTAYPLEHWPEVATQALDNGLEPLFVAAVIRVESGWNAWATSGPGARGLMQVMPETGLDMAGRLRLTQFHPDQLYDPSVNIRIGAYYLAWLQRELGGNRLAALAAYNGGVTNVAAWLRQGRWSGEANSLAEIPFPETRQFVARVLRNYWWYTQLYRPDGSRRW